jgi:hypothetical protein
LTVTVATAGLAPAQQATTLTGVELATGNAPGASGLTISCNPDGSGTASYTVQGQAIGTFPGPFTENATAAFGPRRAATSNSPLTSFSANFTITSGTTQIGGSKQVITSPDSNASCATDGTGSLSFRLRYTATIQNPSGTATDSGCSFGFSQKVPTGVVDSFHETYFTQADPACAPEPPANIVRDLAASGVLNQGNANALLAKLNAAAINQLQAFINQVQALVQSRRLTAEQGQALIDAANHRIDQLDGP